jgi:hypothetical protein
MHQNKKKFNSVFDALLFFKIIIILCLFNYRLY